MTALPHTTTAIYGRNNKPGSAALRLFMWSRFSHEAIVDGDVVIESTADGGVHETPLREFIDRYTYCEMHEKPSAYPHEEVVRRARTQIGKKYDWSAIFGIAFRTGWDNPDCWVCSELRGWASGVVSPHRTGRYTVEDSYKLAGTIINVYKRRT